MSDVECPSCGGDISWEATDDWYPDDGDEREVTCPHDGCGVALCVRAMISVDYDVELAKAEQ